jgi:alkanesulfonate monooxygenase SsuD/methylene tetrahydromethanopterin reductase-like flavin-dependent oxidoreductase (luciferase family)
VTGGDGDTEIPPAERDLQPFAKSTAGPPTYAHYAAVTDAQFGVVVHGVESLPKLERLVHRADDLGYDVVAAPDHLGYPARSLC